MNLDFLNVILVKTRFPENIGMAARACANMGVSSLSLVCPELWRPKAAYALATPKGAPILENMRFYESLDEALAQSNQAFATSARIGGWRKSPLSPALAAKIIAKDLACGSRVSLVFGPEDKGLANSELNKCRQLVHIKTYGGASSVNLAQSVLLLLYECAKATEQTPQNHVQTDSILISDMTLLENNLKSTLKLLDCSPGKNPDYYFLQWQSLLARARLRRHEFDMLMGFCRQIINKIKGG